MILYLDTETTGLYPGNICQLSYIMQDSFGVKAKNFYFSVDYIESGAQAVHGLSVEKLCLLSDGKRFLDHAEEIQKDLAEAQLVVSHNTSFDFMFLRAEFERAGIDFYVKDSFCSMKKTTAICKLKRTNSTGYKYPKLSELTAHFGIDDSEILSKTKTIFGADCGFHDSRFDTVAVYLSLNRAQETEKSLSSVFACI